MKGLRVSLLMVWAALSFLGCSSASTKDPRPSTKKGIMDAYLFKVNKTDGINRSEAILLAQSQMIFLGYSDSYNLAKPDMVAGNKNQWVFKFYPVGKTLKELITKPKILISINRKDGTANWKEEYPQE